MRAVKDWRAAFAVEFVACAMTAWACTRVVFVGTGGASGEVITARSMDWKVDTGTDLWIFPRGMKRVVRPDRTPYSGRRSMEA
jgi:penicillin V acylase-like amidase (Ntn superfamily)